MYPPPVAVELDAFEHVLLRLLPRLAALAVHQLALERLGNRCCVHLGIAINAGGTGLRCARRAASHIDTEGQLSGQ